MVDPVSSKGQQAPDTPVGWDYWNPRRVALTLAAPGYATLLAPILSFVFPPSRPWLSLIPEVLGVIAVLCAAIALLYGLLATILGRFVWTRVRDHRSVWVYVGLVMSSLLVSFTVDDHWGVTLRPRMLGS